VIKTVLAGSILAAALLFAGQQAKAAWLCGPEQCVWVHHHVAAVPSFAVTWGPLFARTASGDAVFLAGGGSSARRHHTTHAALPLVRSRSARRNSAVLMGRSRGSPARHTRHAAFLRENVFPTEFSDGAAGRNRAHCGDAHRLSRPRVPAARHSSGDRRVAALGRKFARSLPRIETRSYKLPWLRHEPASVLPLACFTLPIDAVV
jgi:hypothetical protein